eukprot:7178074-Alexandrium_andersonii.AAC.1
MIVVAVVRPGASPRRGQTTCQRRCLPPHTGDGGQQLLLREGVVVVQEARRSPPHGETARQREPRIHHEGELEGRGSRDRLE